MDVTATISVRLDDGTSIEVTAEAEQVNDHAGYIEHVALEAVNRAQHAASANAKDFADQLTSRYHTTVT